MSGKAMGSRWITRISLIPNWFEELKAKAPAGGAK